MTSECYLILIFGVTFFTIKASTFCLVHYHAYASELGNKRALALPKRHEESCSYNEHECLDGLCVRGQPECNGIFECSDGSDEAFSLCRSRRCHKGQFRCNYGACIDKGDVCNGRRDCVDNSDELGSKCTGRVLKVGGRFLCRSGELISGEGRCDGVTDCKDGSDERVAACVEVTCQPDHFQCEYGACVDGAAKCNGTAECWDGSDELLEICGQIILVRPSELSNSTTEAGVTKGQFECRSGQLMPEKGRCDGVADCKDGSDESVAACVGLVCQPEQFQCGYGGCVEGAAKCNGTAECRDGSDELLDVCGKITPVETNELSNGTTEAGVIKCALPQRPENGVYRIVSETSLDDANSVQLEYACSFGFKLVGEVRVLCGEAWPELPYCVQTCPLARHDSVEYQCTDEGEDELRSCGPEEPEGAIARPKCKQHYYSPVELPYMRCSGGAWSSGPICAPECGKLIPKLMPSVLGGETTRPGDVPWHIGIYRKGDSSDQYQQICGGSLISNTVVLSAAHCFWDEQNMRLVDEAEFALASGKLYKAWHHPKDERYEQKSNVSKIVVPKTYRGRELYYRHDIAVVIASQPFQYKPNAMPACLDFRAVFGAEQLKGGSYGKIAVWATTEIRDLELVELKLIDLPFVDGQTCLDRNSRADLHNNTNKFCAGSLEGEALCRGNSGGGLSFASNISGVERYYLRGIASTSPLLNDRVSYNVNSLTSFTSVIKYEEFIKRYLYG